MPLLLCSLFFLFRADLQILTGPSFVVATYREIPKHALEESGGGGHRAAFRAVKTREGPSPGTAKRRLPSRARLAAAEAAPGRGASHRAGLAGGQRLSRTGRSRGGGGAASPGTREPRSTGGAAPAWEPLPRPPAAAARSAPGGRWARAGAAQVRRCAGRAALSPSAPPRLRGRGRCYGPAAS